MSNDSTEGRWILNIFDKAWVKYGSNVAHKEEMLNHLENHLDNMSAFGFCLSQEGDLLSQWRGYADNAAGISIGFDKPPQSNKSQENIAHPFDILPKAIEYNESEQIKMMVPHIEKIKLRSDEDGLIKSEYAPKRLETDKLALIACFNPLVETAYSMKNDGFEEEKEVRLMVRFYDTDSRVNGENNSLKTFARGTQIVPFFSINLDEAGIPPIKRVIIGPRNTTPKEVIETLLKRYGFGDIKVDKSKISYR